MIVNIRLDLTDEQLRKVSGKFRLASRKEVTSFVNELLQDKLNRLSLPVGRGRPLGGVPGVVMAAVSETQTTQATGESELGED